MQNTKLPSLLLSNLITKDLQNKTHTGLHTHTRAHNEWVLHQYRLERQQWWGRITALVCVCLLFWENMIRNMVIHCTEAHCERKEQLWSVCVCCVCACVPAYVIHSFYQWRQSWILFITPGRWSQSHLTYFYLEANALCSIIISHLLWQISGCRHWA